MTHASEEQGKEEFECDFLVEASPQQNPGFRIPEAGLPGAL